MFGSMGGVADLGIIPCAISWLFKGISEHREKFGSRFSVRMSALAVGSKAHDLLAGMASGEAASWRCQMANGIIKT